MTLGWLPPPCGIHLISRQSARFQIHVESGGAVVASVDSELTIHLHLTEFGLPTPLVIHATLPRQGPTSKQGKSRMARYGCMRHACQPRFRVTAGCRHALMSAAVYLRFGFSHVFLSLGLTLHTNFLTGSGMAAWKTMRLGDNETMRLGAWETGRRKCSLTH